MVTIAIFFTLVVLIARSKGLSALRIGGRFTRRAPDAASIAAMPHTNPVIQQNAGIHHVALRTAHFDRAFTFYTETLGCQPGMQWGDPGKRAVMLDVGDGNYIEIFERDETGFG